jgi:hypothetical protein
MAAKKIDADKLKEEFDSLEPDEQSAIKKALGIPDEDAASTLKDIIKRLTALEGKKKDDKGEPKRGFFSTFFE